MFKLAISILIGSMGLAYADPLPNLIITPGVARNDLTLQQICTIAWGKDHRHVSEKLKQQVFVAYGYSGDQDKRCPCEIDHLISRELGGADDVKNLWPQSYRGAWNAHLKDRLENRLHVDVCSGKLRLQDAQSALTKDWTKVYIHYFGNPP